MQRALHRGLSVCTMPIMLALALALGCLRYDDHRAPQTGRAAHPKARRPARLCFRLRSRHAGLAFEALARDEVRAPGPAAA